MDPITAQNVDLAKAVQALLVRQGTAMEGALQALLGQDVEMLFQSLAPDGAKLQLPSGQVITAQGELPYPEGTQLRVRIQPPTTGETAVRLQLQEARPPASPALLSPLAQSEAQTLAARLSTENPAPELLPLLRLLSVLSDTPPAAATLPSGSDVRASLSQLPGAVLADLKQVLGAGGATPVADLATRLLALLQDVQAAQPGAAPFLSARTGTIPPELAEPKGLEALVQQVLARLAPGLPEGHRAALDTLIRDLFQKATEQPAPAKSSSLPMPARTEGTQRSAVAETLVPPRLATALQAHLGPKAELPESWESWIRGTVRALADPAVSPREAPFHAIQAKEGTALFEIPLPWAQASPLQLWVESDAPEDHQHSKDTTKRVLLGLKFSRLGETRLGMAQGTFGLQIRIWTEYPEALESERERMEEELKSLDKPFDLKIYALTYGPDGTIPSVRSLATGPCMNALG